MRFKVLVCSASLACILTPERLRAATQPADEARRLLQTAGVRGGLVVHLGCGDGRLTAALRINERFVVQGLDADPANVRRARAYIRSRGLCGKVSVARWTKPRLPYAENLVNLLVAERLAGTPMPEVLRVLAPGGAAVVKRGGKWTKVVKPRPADIDEWTHMLHDAGNNAVARDAQIGPPDRMQWLAAPRQTRHHEHLASITTVVSAGGRLFSIEDHAPAASIVLPAEWFLVARDAFSGVKLWERRIPSWYPHLWPFRKGPPQLGRRLVAAGDRVYVTLGLRAPVSELDAATGEVRRVYAGTEGTEEILFHRGALLLAIGDARPPKEAEAERDRRLARLLAGTKDWSETVRGNAWDMNEPGDAPGRGHVKDVTFKDGVMRFTTRRDPIVVLNLSGRRIDRSYCLFAVRMYASKAGFGQVYYWSPDGDWQGYRLPDVRKGWRTYVLDLRKARLHGPGGGSDQHAAWGGKSGVIHKFRFDPIEAGGVEIQIDWVKLIQPTEDLQRRLADILANKKALAAVDAAAGRTRWRKTVVDLMPTTLAANGRRVFYWDRDGVACLDFETGAKVWRAPLPPAERRPEWSAPTLVATKEVVLCADRERKFTPRRPKGRVSLGERLRLTRPLGRLTALDARTGERLWSCRASEGYNSPPDVFVIDGLVWIGHTQARHFPDYNEGRDLRTGEVKRRFDTTKAFSPPFHHRCYRDKATVRYIVMSKVGTEFIDLRTGRNVLNSWVRGVCQYGVLPCNGLLYSPPHSCACYIQGKLNGFWALAPAAGRPEPSASDDPLERGPAYDALAREKQDASDAAWPTYRHDSARSGCAAARVPARLRTKWRARLGGKLTPPVVADGFVFVAQVDAHTLYALDAASGRVRWAFTAAGRIDSPPTIHRGRVLFGCADGRVYCLRERDGALAWRFRAAPADRWVVAFDQVESAWPVHGSVLVDRGELFFVAGRSSFLDGGLFLYRLDPLTGRVLSHARLSTRDPRTDEQRPEDVHNMDMAGALPDILSSDGRHVFMRYLRLDRRSLKPVDDFQALFKPKPGWRQTHRTGDPLYCNPDLSPHLFCPTGFLDDSWWHRCYWMYGTFFPGCCPYFNAGVFTPAGRILTFDAKRVYGFGRGPQFWGWWTPLGYHLFAAPRQAAPRGKGWRKRRYPANWQGVIRLGAYGTRVPYAWREKIPFYVRALALAGDRLFVAGPPQMIDETRADVRAMMRDEALARKTFGPALEAWKGKFGARLRVVSCDDGRTLAEQKLDELPVFDGMAAAYGRLYLSTLRGVLCLAGGEPAR